MARINTPSTQVRDLVIYVYFNGYNKLKYDNGIHSNIPW